MKYLLLILIYLLMSPDAPKRQMVIVLQPFGDFREKESRIVQQKVRALHRDVILRPNVNFPKKSYYRPRSRYRAEAILENLTTKFGPDTIVAGLSLRDISTTKGDIYDWGVMGLGYRPGNACVISTFRLSPKNRDEQFYKVVLHELGHTQGLPHCPVKTCLMRDAEGGNPLDDEKDFCNSCKNFLIGKGWKLKN